MATASVLGVDDGAPMNVARDRLERMFRDHHEFIWRLLRRLGLGSDVAADLTQQVYLVAAERLSDIRPESERGIPIWNRPTLIAQLASPAAALPTLGRHGHPSVPRSTSGPEELTSQRQAIALLDQILYETRGRPSDRLRSVRTRRAIDRQDCRNARYSAWYGRLETPTGARSIQNPRRSRRALIASSEGIMKDPERLLEGTTTDFERTVLRAARLEQPSVAQRRRMRPRPFSRRDWVFKRRGFKAAAGIGNQLVVVAVIAGVLAGTGSSSLTTSSLHRPQTYAPAAVQPAVNPASVGQAPAITDDAPNGIRAEELTLETTKDRDVKPPPRTVAPAKTIDLREEIRLLDEALDCTVVPKIQEEHFRPSTVNRYLAQFPRGSFRQEASVLRIEALAMTGNNTQAATEAKRFMTTHPSSPHVDKLQRITQSATGPTKP